MPTGVIVAIVISILGLVIVTMAVVLVVVMVKRRHNVPSNQETGNQTMQYVQRAPDGGMVNPMYNYATEAGAAGQQPEMPPAYAEKVSHPTSNEHSTEERKNSKTLSDVDLSTQNYLNLSHHEDYA